jgi:hypothetical protein
VLLNLIVESWRDTFLPLIVLKQQINLEQKNKCLFSEYLLVALKPLCIDKCSVILFESREKLRLYVTDMD